MALLIESLVRTNNSANRPTVLGLATGSTPVGLYRELIRLHKEAGLDFSRVITFNLDEYYPIRADDPHSYNRWMWETFFRHVNIPKQNIHIPDGTILANQVEDYCTAYEQKIRRAGGIDGRNRVGFCGGGFGRLADLASAHVIMQRLWAMRNSHGLSGRLSSNLSSFR